MADVEAFKAITFSETRLRSFGDFYMTLVEVFGEDDAKTLMSPLINVGVEIALRRMQEKQDASV